MKSRAKLITRIVLIVLITAVAALITVNILFKGQDSRMGGPPPGANTPSMNSGFGFDPEASNIVSVNVIKTEKNKIEEYIKTNGDVLSKSSVNIYPDTSGRLVELYVSLGEYIRKGQIIGEVDPSKPGSVYSHNNVVSPISGTVTELPSDLGSSVTVQTAIAVIGDLNDLIIQCFISERYVSKITAGHYAEFKLEAYPDVVFSARIIEKSPVIDRTTRTMEVRLEPEPMDKRIQPGMFASLKITTQRKNDVIVIPDSCILSSDQEYWVYVINENNSAKKRIIKTGLSSLGFTEITEGLIEGETIVSRGQNLLSDGVTVNIVEIKE